MATALPSRAVLTPFTVRHLQRQLRTIGSIGRDSGAPTEDVPAGLADPNVIPRHDELNTDPAVIAAIAAVRPLRPAAVLVPIIDHNQLSVLFIQAHRTSCRPRGTDFVPGRKDPMSGTKARRQPGCERPRRRSRFAAALSSRSAILTST